MAAGAALTPDPSEMTWTIGGRIGTFGAVRSIAATATAHLPSHILRIQAVTNDLWSDRDDEPVARPGILVGSEPIADRRKVADRQTLRPQCWRLTSASLRHAENPTICCASTLAYASRRNFSRVRIPLRSR